MRLYALMALGLCLAVPARAGLFADDTARGQIQQLEARITTLEESLKESLKQQTRSVLDLQGQIESLNGEIRKLRGQNEELAHGLQDAGKRQKDFYVDLDARLRVLETAAEAAAKEAEQAATALPVSADPHDPVPENRAFESAYSMYRGGKHAEATKAFREFLGKYPDSAHAANAHYWLGSAQRAQKDCKEAVTSYRVLIKEFPTAPRAADAYLGIAECKRELKQKDDANKTLRQLIEKYPGSEAAAKAKKLLPSAK